MSLPFKVQDQQDSFNIIFTAQIGTDLKIGYILAYDFSPYLL